MDEDIIWDKIKDKIMQLEEEEEEKEKKKKK